MTVCKHLLSLGCVMEKWEHATEHTIGTAPGPQAVCNQIILEILPSSVTFGLPAKRDVFSVYSSALPAFTSVAYWHVEKKDFKWKINQFVKKQFSSTYFLLWMIPKNSFRD